MKLADHLHEKRTTPRAWVKANELPKDGVYRHLKGKRIEYDTAKRISAATGGAVSISEIMD